VHIVFLDIEYDRFTFDHFSILAAHVAPLQIDLCFILCLSFQLFLPKVSFFGLSGHRM